ncbi:tetratricopeptide repeat protein [uncultured Aquabacterium sp.]|uniref:tetratricopeptide repeat protein n=1 Tax=Aquabacterium sp. TaxID=1872578 RepID=UPI0025E460A2|nr:tetratricopeptide repeat protein [uncultured Aquabacterium sp.]
MTPSDTVFVSGALALSAVPVIAVLRPWWRVARGAGMAVSGALLAGAVVGYLAVGQPGMWSARVPHQQAVVAPSGEGGAIEVEAMVQRLASRLQKQPDDVDGWRKLIRSYETLQRFDDAVVAWRRLLQLVPPDADQLTEYAVTLGMARGQRLSGEPEQVLEQALKLDPDHVQALALLGSAAFERGNHALAIARWQALLARAPADTEVRARIQAQIDKARALAGSDAGAGAAR